MTGPTGTRGRSRVLGVLQLATLVVLLSGVLGVGIHGAVAGLAETVPAASFDFEYDPATEELVVTHEGGDPVPADELRFAGVDGDCDGDDWGANAGSVSAGDSCTLEGVPPDAELRVAWDGVGPNTATLDGWSGPAA